MASGDIFGDLGGATSDLFGAFGDFAEAKGYKTAAKLASQNAQIAAQSTAIQVMATNRQAFQVIGGQESDVAGAGLKSGGSAGDLLRSSQQQASLQKQLIENQGEIEVHGWQEKAAADTAQAQAKKAGGIGGLIGTALNIGAAIFGI